MIPQILLSLIRKFEGLRLTAYLCPAGIPTIGYGATGADVRIGLTWTIEQAEARLLEDALLHIKSTMKLCPATITNINMLSALADFSYNLGATRLKRSTLLRKINFNDIDGAKKELMKWTKGGGKVLPGLVLRRQAEALLFL